MKPVPIQVHDDDPYIGAKQAKVTIVEAFEFACPYCAMLDPIMDEVMKQHEGQPVKLVEKQFVVHPQIATDAALAACAANRMGAYERYSEALWDKSWKQDGRWSLDQQALQQQSLIALAAEVGLDRERFQAELTGAACKDKLMRDKVELGRAGVRVTPSLFINGRPVAASESRSIRWLTDIDDATGQRATQLLKGPDTLRRRQIERTAAGQEWYESRARDLTTGRVVPQ